MCREHKFKPQQLKGFKTDNIFSNQLTNQSWKPFFVRKPPRIFGVQWERSINEQLK